VNYAFEWVPDALDNLAAVWLASKNRNAVTQAANDIENVLTMFPNSAGEISFDSVREFIYPPLGVEFEVDDVNHRVVVLSVWDTDQGKPLPTGN
jgi:hypothetical protein